MPITATNPTTVPPASAPAVYDKWWISSFVIDAPDPASAKVSFTLRKYRDLPDGSIEFSPADGAVNATIEQVFLVAATDPIIGPVFGAILGGMQAYGQRQGLI